MYGISYLPWYNIALKWKKQKKTRTLFEVCCYRKLSWKSNRWYDFMYFFLWSMQIFFFVPYTFCLLYFLHHFYNNFIINMQPLSLTLTRSRALVHYYRPHHPLHEWLYQVAAINDKMNQGKKIGVALLYYRRHQIRDWMSQLTYRLVTFFSIEWNWSYFASFVANEPDTKKGS